MESYISSGWSDNTGVCFLSDTLSRLVGKDLISTTPCLQEWIYNGADAIRVMVRIFPRAEGRVYAA